ncbi:MAG: DNA polymerase III subunit alpha [Pseudomonadota bacterium]
MGRRSSAEANKPFVHLHVHSAYSLLEGAVHVGALKDLCLKHGMPALAVTDTDNLFGALEASEVLSAAGVQPITGSQVSLAWSDFDLKEQRSAPRPSVVLLAQNQSGYENLMKLSSAAFLRSESDEGPTLSLASLADHAGGLICLTGGPSGPINRLIVDGRCDAAEAALQRLKGIFPDRLYVELQRHETEAEIVAEGPLVDLAYDLDLPLVATNEVYFPSAEAYEAHDALRCIAEGAYVHQDDRARLTSEHYFKTGAEMAALFSDLPEAMENAIEIARRCAFRPRTHAPILPRFVEKEGWDEAAELAAQARDGLKARLERHGAAAPEDDYWTRLDYELDIINRMGFPGYFLIVSDFIKWAKAHDIPVGPGRGSGAGSVVAWALTITDLDPLRFGLLFERFLNPERVSMPDFDVDFCQDRRDEVIEYVQQRYGEDKVAQIITFGKLQARAVLRDVGRVLSLPYGQVDRLCKLVPNNPANPVTLAEAVEGEPRLQEERDKEPEVADLLEKSLRLEGLYRHASTHAAGVVIGDRPLDELVPLYTDPRSDMPVTQFNMRWVEPAGLVKFDFLGLKTLTVLERAVKFLKQNGVDIDLSALPLDDATTYEMLGEGAATGVFQLESAGMRSTLKAMKPDSLEDIIALVSLYRPGPMENIPTYIECKKGAREPDYLHPWLEPVLKETYGVIIYQEQVMQIAQILSGYSLGEADLLRRAMGKKKKEEMDRQKVRFLEGAVEKGVDEKKADGIFELVAKFAGYGFNKSHAAAYAYIAYQTAYLKANHPAEFLAASMSLDIGNTDKLAVFLKEAARVGVEVRPPDVNQSEADFSVRDGVIYYALGAIKNVGLQAMEGIVGARKQGGAFKDVMDFAERIDAADANKRAIENLARAGAFDALNANRAQTTAAADLVVRVAARAAEERASAQESLFGGADAAPERPRLPAAEEWLSLQRLDEERGALGFYFSGHPLDDYETALGRLRVTSHTDLLERAVGGKAGGGVAGVVRAFRPRKSKSGRPFAWVELSDQAGEYEVTAFSEVLANARDLFEPGNLLLLSVTAEDRDGDVRMTCENVRALDQAAAGAAAGLKIYLDDERGVAAVRRRLEAVAAPHGGADAGAAPRDGAKLGAVSLVLRLSDTAREVELRLPEAYPLTPAVASALKAAEGVAHVETV